MRRRDFLKASGLGLAALTIPKSLARAAAEEARPSRRPNIILILADDVGLPDIGCYGGDGVKTPHIDALAGGGIRFNRGFATPLCGPSRCQLLTGRYPFRTGLIHNNCGNVISPKRDVMIQTPLKQAGYRSALVGKWGQLAAGPAEWGFDEYLVFPGNGVYTNKQEKNYGLSGKAHALADGEYMPDLMHDFAADFIARNQAGPFFLYYPMSHMHSPIVPTPDSKPGGNRYAENIEYMDKLVGKLVAEVDRLKLRQETLILFMGDNGTTFSHPGMIGGKAISGAKGSMLEGGSRVPLIVNWPGTTPAGQVREDLIDFSDIFPTLAELAGAKLPEGVTLDGRSFAEQVAGRPGTPREWIYVELNGNSFAREDRWKLTNRGDLFDMREAPFAEKAVPRDAPGEEVAAARRRLQAVLDSHPAAKGDPKQNNKAWMTPAGQGS